MSNEKTNSTLGFSERISRFNVHYWVFSYTTAIVVYLCVSLARFQVKQEKRWILSINGTASAITWAKKKPSVKDFGYTTEDAENLAAFNRIEITPLD